MGKGVDLAPGYSSPTHSRQCLASAISLTLPFMLDSNSMTVLYIYYVFEIFFTEKSESLDVSDLRYSQAA